MEAQGSGGWMESAGDRRSWGRGGEDEEAPAQGRRNCWREYGPIVLLFVLPPD
jgi:hypothetical protein